MSLSFKRPGLPASLGKQNSPSRRGAKVGPQGLELEQLISNTFGIVKYTTVW
jgi:hypothetical protein